MQLADAKLLARGGRVLPHLSYRTFYYGAAWRADPAHPGNPHALARPLIDGAIAAAASDPALNAILEQYTGGQTVTATALPSDIIDNDPRAAPVNQPFNERDILRVLGLLVPRMPAECDFATTAIVIVLPQGMTLEVLGIDEAQRPPGTKVTAGVPRDQMNCSTGIAGFHGSMAVPGAPGEVLYAVAVWSDGSTGIPVPSWQGWENITATLYHELQEIRTNPDVDVAIRTGDGGRIGWNTDPIEGPDNLDCREIADLALIREDVPVQASFGKVPVAGGATVPIQLLWSNRDNGLMPKLPI